MSLRTPIPFVENQIDDVEDGVEPAGQLVPRRDLIRDTRVANLRLCPDDALRDGWRVHQKRPPDLLRLQPAHFAQRQRDLRIQRQRRMTAGEDQPQPIVLDTLFACLGRLRSDRAELLGKLQQRRVMPCAAANAVDRLEAARRHEPGARVVWQAVTGPLLDGRSKGVVHGLLCAIEIAEQANEGRQHAPRVGAVNGIDHLPRALA